MFLSWASFQMTFDIKNLVVHESTCSGQFPFTRRKLIVRNDLTYLIGTEYEHPASEFAQMR